MKLTLSGSSYKIELGQTKWWTNYCTWSSYHEVCKIKNIHKSLGEKDMNLSLTELKYAGSDQADKIPVEKANFKIKTAFRS